MSTVLTLIQARTSSERLPRKLFAPIGTTIALEHILRAAVPPAILATPEENDEDTKRIKDMCDTYEVDYYRSNLPVADVLGRLTNALRHYELTHKRPDYILRVTADCPLLTRDFCQFFVLFARFLADAITANGATTIITNRPDAPDGLDLELFSTSLLYAADTSARSPHDREHVTPYVYEIADQVLTIPVAYDITGEKWSLDDASDLIRINNVIRMKSLQFK